MVHFCLKIPRLNTCFCCLSLRTGAIILGTIGTLSAFYGFSAGLYMVLSFQHDTYENPYPTPYLLYWNVTAESISVLMQLLLLLGIFINSPKYLLPMLWIEAVLIIAGYLSFIVLLVTDPYLSLVYFNFSKYEYRFFRSHSYQLHCSPFWFLGLITCITLIISVIR